jgi:transposase-like protein
VPDDVWPEFHARAQACCQAASPALARVLREDIVTTYGSNLPSAVACLDDDFEACIAHLKFPLAHRRAIRTTNLLERLFGEERRQLKAIRDELNRDHVERTAPAAGANVTASPTRLSSKDRT